MGRVILYVSDLFRKPTAENAKSVYEVISVLLNIYSLLKEPMTVTPIVRRFQILYSSHSMPTPIARAPSL